MAVLRGIVCFFRIRNSIIHWYVYLWCLTTHLNQKGFAVCLKWATIAAIKVCPEIDFRATYFSANASSVAYTGWILKAIIYKHPKKLIIKHKTPQVFLIWMLQLLGLSLSNKSKKVWIDEAQSWWLCQENRLDARLSGLEKVHTTDISYKQKQKGTLNRKGLHIS